MKKTYIQPTIDLYDISKNTPILCTSGAVGATGVDMSWDDTAADSEVGLSHDSDFDFFSE